MTYFVGFSFYKVIYYIAKKILKMIVRNMEKSFNFAKEQAKKMLEKKERQKETQLTAVKEMLKIKLQAENIKIIEEELVEKFAQMDKDYNNKMTDEE